MPPQPSSTQPRSCAALLSAESETPRALSQFTHSPLSPVMAPALPNWCTPPQPSRVTPVSLERGAPGVRAFTRAIVKLGQLSTLVIDGGIDLLASTDLRFLLQYVCTNPQLLSQLSPS